MKHKFLFLIFVLFAFSSCTRREGSLIVYPAKEYIVASDIGCCAGEGGWKSYFFVKEKGKSTWEQYDDIHGLDYERGYEYLIKAEKIIDEDRIKLADDACYLYLRLVKVLSSEKKDTEGLPDNYISYRDDLPPPGRILSSLTTVIIPC